MKPKANVCKEELKKCPLIFFSCVLQNANLLPDVYSQLRAKCMIRNLNIAAIWAKIWGHTWMNIRCWLYTAVSVFLSPPGYTGYKLCYQEVLKVVKGIIHQPYELEDTNVFYAFSYYFDRAVDAGLIG